MEDEFNLFRKFVKAANPQDVRMIVYLTNNQMSQAKKLLGDKFSVDKLIVRKLNVEEKKIVMRSGDEFVYIKNSSIGDKKILKTFKENDYTVIVLSDLLWLEKSKLENLEGMEVEGIVKNSGSYVEIQFDLDQDMLETIARDYIKEKRPGWNVRRPYAWTDYGSKPHVTLANKMIKYKGEKVKVSFGKLYDFVDSGTGTRWVAVRAYLPEKYSCEYECHMSIGQQRMIKTGKK